jgi:adenylate cyclase
VLEGSVRKAGSRVRITGQLIEAATGAHRWADKFDGQVEDVFDLQDNVTMRVVGAIVPKLDSASIELVERKPPENWSSYDHYLRGRALVDRPALGAIDEAEAEFRKAIELDPGFALAYAFASVCTHRRRKVGKRPPSQEQRSTATRLADRALELAPDDDLVLSTAWVVIDNVDNQHERGGALADRAVALNPNSVTAWIAQGWSSVYLDRLDQGSVAFERAIRLNPLDREQVRNAHFGLAWISQLTGRYTEGAAWANRMIAEDPTDLTALGLLEANLFHGGRQAEAKQVAERIRVIYPLLRASQYKNLYGSTRKPEHAAIFAGNIDRLRLPE